MSADFTVHIPAQSVQVGSRLRQRCAWCGITLLDYDLERVASPLEPCPECQGRALWSEVDGIKCATCGGTGKKPWTGPATWEAGSLVATTDGGGVSYVVEHVDGEKLPDNACAQLDDEVTR